MAYAILLLMILAAVGGLWLLRVRGGLLLASATALMLGAAGYAVQGNPDLPGAPAEGNLAHSFVDVTQARHAFFGDFSPEEPWLRMSDALARDGESEDAVGVLKNAVGKYPGDPQLWIGLGNALVDHARGLTPPAEFAYQRAAELSPGYPAAPFFYGLALARSGDRADAVALWKRVLARAPTKASWRPLIEQGIAVLDESPSAAQRTSP